MANALSEVLLRYQLLHNAQGNPSGVRLQAQRLGQGAGAEAAQALPDLLDTLWPAHATPVLLGSADTSLLGDWLAQARSTRLRIVLTQQQYQDPTLARAAQAAARRGLKLVWHGEPGARLKAAETLCFDYSILALDAEQALQCLRCARQPPSRSRHAQISPVLPGQVYEGVASVELARHCLQQGASAVLGWPIEDAIFSQRQQRIQVNLAALQKLLQATQADAASEQLQRLLQADPLLVYRFLRFANSAGAGLHRAIETPRHGLQVLGLDQLKAWLQQQLPHASADDALQPLRAGLSLRARIMAELADQGQGLAIGHPLGAELTLCGLLSQIDLLLGETLQTACHALALPGAISRALLGQQGEYWPYLALACAQEASGPATLQTLSQRHQIDASALNTALLRALVAMVPAAAPS